MCSSITSGTKDHKVMIVVFFRLNFLVLKILNFVYSIECTSHSNVQKVNNGQKISEGVQTLAKNI